MVIIIFEQFDSLICVMTMGLNRHFNDDHLLDIGIS
jgi:hypothetical protein